MFMRTGILPSQIMALPPFERAFCIAAMQVTLEAEYGRARDPLTGEQRQ